MKEICTLLVKLHIIFSRMQRVNQHARPSIIQVGCPTYCVHWTMQMGVLQTWIKAQDIVIVMLNQNQLCYEGTTLYLNMPTSGLFY